MAPELTYTAEILKNAHNTNIQDSMLNAVGRDLIINNEGPKIDIQAKLSLLNAVSHKGHYVPYCMEGTRKGLFEKINDWLNDFDESTPNILWITGYPGAGKSAITSTLVSKLSQSQRLIGYHFFKRDDAVLSDSCVVWRTTAATMASKHTTIAEGMSMQLDNNFRIEDIKWHFENLIHMSFTKYLDKLNNPVMVIDALDECKRNADMYIFVSTLFSWSKFPKNCKLIITSRPGYKPVKLRNPNICIDYDLEIGINAGSETNNDIIYYVRNKFEESYDWMEWKPSEQDLHKIAEKAAGLFIYASTVVEFITSEEQGEILPKRKLKNILENQEKSTVSGIDSLYIQILSMSFSCWSEKDKLIVQNVLAIIILAKAPLHINDILYFISDQKDDDLNDTIEIIFKHLQPVVSTDTGKVSTRHLLFVEFLMERCQLEQYKINKTLFSVKMATAIYKILNNDLKFNICNLESSYNTNDNVNDLAKRIQQFIPNYLQYCCMYWPLHKIDISMDESREELEQFMTFLQHKFLYWLEVMSLLNEIPMALGLLNELLENYENKEINVKYFMVDAVEFIMHFYVPITTSAPHIYLSALPFAPGKSVILNQYKDKFRNTISRLGKIEQDWIYKGIKVYHHTARVTCVVFSHSGNQILVGLVNCTIALWDIRTGKIIAVPFEGHTKWVTSVVFSPDGKWVVSGSYDGTVRIWDVESGAVAAGPFEGHTNKVISVAFSPDGKKVVSGSYDKTVRIWGVESGTVAASPFEGHTDWVTSVAFSPGGKWVVSGSYDTTVRIWDVESGTLAADPFEGHTQPVTSVAFSPDGKQVVSGSNDTTVRIWDVKSGTVSAGPFEGHTNGITSVAFSPDGKKVVSGSYDKTVRIWDVESGAVAAGPFEGHAYFVTSVAFSPDGKKVVSGSYDKTVRISGVESSTVAAGPFEGHTQPVTSVAFSPDGKQVVSSSDDETVRIWDVESGTVAAGPFEGHTNGITSVAFSPDGKWVVSGSYDKTVRIWDVKNGTVAAGPFEGHTKWVTSVAFSPGGKWVVSGSGDDTVRIWDVESGTLAAGPFEGHTHWVTSVAFSSGRKWVVSGSGDNTVIIWDVESGTLAAGPFEGHTQPVTSVAFSPDGKQVVSGSDDETVRIWDVGSGAVFAGPFEGHTNGITSVVFSPDGKQVVSGSYDKTVRIWGVESGTVSAGLFESHTNAVTSVAFSPDGKQVVSGSYDKTVRIWDVESVTISSGSLEGNTNFIKSRELDLKSQHVRNLQLTSDHLTKLLLLGGSSIYISCYKDGWVRDRYNCCM